MIRILIPVLLLLLQHTTDGQGKWTVDSSSVTFQIRNAGIPVSGTFDGLEANIVFDPKRLDNSRISASVDAGTVNTGIRIRDKHLRKSDFFHVDVHPKIEMHSTGIRNGVSDQYLGTFALFLKGKQEEITIPFTFKRQSPFAVLQGNFAIDRQNYDIGGHSLILADTVSVNIWVRMKEQ